MSEGNKFGGGAPEGAYYDPIKGVFWKPHSETATETPVPTLEGNKFDTDKLPWHLLPPDALEEIVEVLQFGATKYGDRNWEAGMSWHRPFAALMRHMWAWWRREEADPETNLSHLAHAGCCLLFLLAYEKRVIGKDDRP